MLIPATLHQEITALKIAREEETLERKLLKAYADIKESGTVDVLEYVVFELAHFYSRPRTENLEKAEAFFLEHEKLAPGARTKRATAQFYFVISDPQKVVAKVDEIDPQEPDRASYYSALTLKGQAFIDLGMLNGASTVLDELLNMVRMNPRGLPYGDEMNLLEVGVAIEMLRPKCCELLGLVVPKIRDQEYRDRGEELLKECRVPAGGPVINS